ncbi:hypothetical protein IMCC14465_05030 [alpha proteobacterium IMCC14465]|uniref:O-antigen polymerase n=1 Tax=alpha proteobacterium IMCC14465 TaxID=1220535 RepID=J9E2M3_9PROT|nr:hypothetical protein IMCC14465_05030 [alpha proteobacterium IMCC14465]
MLPALKAILLVFLLRAFYDLIFIIYLTGNWSYLGYTLELSYWKIVFSYVLLPFVALLALAPNYERPSHFFTSLFVLFVLLPYQTVGALGGGYLHHILVPFVCLLILVNTNKLKFRIPLIKQQNPMVLSVLFAFITAYFVFVLSRSGFSEFNLNLYQVYDFRATQKENVQAGIFAYIGNWVGKVLLPIMAVYSLHKKKYIIFSLALLLTFLAFGVANQKTSLLFPFLSIGIYLFLSMQNAGFIRLLMTTLLFLTFSFGAFFLINFDLASSFLVRRSIFAAALNFTHYINYFSQYGYLYWSNTIFSSILEYPYMNLSPGQVIGEYVGNYKNVNSGFMASGYMHAGLVGIILYSILLMLVCAFFDSLADKNNRALITAAAAPLILNIFINSDLVIAMGTHGFLLLMFLSIVLSRSRR